MKDNAPIYRAKKIDSNEYVAGQYLVYKGYPVIFNEYGLDGVDIDPTTLSIHFPDMLDSQGNKIFASLQEDGKGGDIVENYSFKDDYKSQISIYDDCKLCLVDKDGDTYCLGEIEYDGIKVIGIQE